MNFWIFVFINIYGDSTDAKAKVSFLVYEEVKPESIKSL